MKGNKISIISRNKMYHTNEVEKYVEMLISTLFYNKFLVIDRKHFFSRPWNTDCSQLMMCGTYGQVSIALDRFLKLISFLDTTHMYSETGIVNFQHVTWFNKRNHCHADMFSQSLERNCNASTVHFRLTMKCASSPRQPTIKNDIFCVE